MHRFEVSIGYAVGEPGGSWYAHCVEVEISWYEVGSIHFEETLLHRALKIFELENVVDERVEISHYWLYEYNEIE